MREEILNMVVLIGNKAFVMMGAKNLTYDNKNISLTWHMGKGSRYRAISIIYNEALDIYKLVFYNWNKVEITDKKEIDGVYFEDVHRIIESNTGFRLSL